VAFAEVERFLDTPVKHYSTGMYLRLAFAVAAHLEPEILLVDEVLAVGDAAFQKKCLRKMKEVSYEGRTVLFVSHNSSAIEQMCDRVFLMQAGRLHVEGSPSSVIARYLDDSSQEEEGDFDLLHHPARLPGCVPVIQRLKLYNESGLQSMRFHPDEAMVAEISVTSPIPISEPRVALSIETNAGQRITTVASFFQDGSLGSIEASARFLCTIPPLRLWSGRYLLSVSIANKYQGMIDGLHNAAWFEIVWGSNGFGNGETYSPDYGPVLTTSTWERIG
jgi:lipopolysaccharide transport system ATP-binding protein